MLPQQRLITEKAEYMAAAGTELRHARCLWELHLRGLLSKTLHVCI
jgi:hypothetical protein